MFLNSNPNRGLPTSDHTLCMFYVMKSPN